MAADDPEFDLVVVGSGAAGMTAALTAARRGLRAVVLEKTEYFGGSTARSGGGVWIPGNSVLRRCGVRVAGSRVPVQVRRAEAAVEWHELVCTCWRWRDDQLSPVSGNGD